MTLTAFRFRRFGVRVGLMLLGLLFAVLALIYLRVTRFSEANALAHATENLEIAARVFEDVTRQRIALLASNATVMSNDPEIRTALGPRMSTEVASVLNGYATRISASMIALFSPDGRVLANSRPGMNNENEGPFRYLIELATRDTMERASDFSYLDNELHVLVVVPLYAPHPKIGAWIALAFPLDAKFAAAIKRTSRVDVTFVSKEDAPNPRILASTLPAVSATAVAHAAAEHPEMHTGAHILDLPLDRYVTLFKMQELLGEDPVAVVLQRPLGPDLASARELAAYLQRTSLLALVVAAAVALWIVRDVSRPVRVLAEHAREVEKGRYDRRIASARVDEFGQLATAFNAMSAGLAERDRVRDLLDKNVSPEIAAQLLRDGAALGGEEREVTILFADLRGFTTMSEKFAPRDLLALLNRYLDRMSAEIERQGGVIDKFIGDAIMALFGAPVGQPDAADRALQAATTMQRALADLNRELAAEGHPALAIGVGVNTARVVAGNIGSHRRLNYSVVGDGVNVASRLQAETRKMEFRTNIVTSRATLAALRAPEKFSARPLGTVQVKGRSEPVEIFAID